MSASTMRCAFATAALLLAACCALAWGALGARNGHAAPAVASRAACVGCPGSATPRADAHLALRRVLLAGVRPQTVTFRVPGSGAGARVVVLVRRAGSAAARAINSWDLGAVDAGSVQQVSWDGLGADGRPAADGRYRFTALVTGPAGAQTAAALGDAFTFLRDFFPVRGPHGYGGPGDRFGAWRAGHAHQGQDILAPCGTPVVAARGGVVKDVAYQWAAGNYVVIDAAGSGADFFYAHLRAPARVQAGQVVVTGQRLGEVGQSGDATACHLHLELWTGPGWYSGGQPFDPWRSIRMWDRETGAGLAAR